MAGRVTLSLLIVFCCLQPEHAVPQDYTAVVGDGRAQPWISPTGFRSGPQDYSGFSAGNPYVDGGGGRYLTPTTPRQPMQYATASTAEPGVGYANGPGFVTTLVDDDEGELEPTPFENLIRRSLHRMWFRTEYLNWSFSNPGDRLLGDKTLLTGNPTNRFVVTNPGPGPVTATARVMDLGPIDLGDNNGIRGTFGIPFRTAVLEISGFAFDQADDTLVGKDIRRAIADTQLPGGGQSARFIGTTFTLNGKRSLVPPRLYDESFSARFTSSLWGVGGNIVFNTDSNPGEGLRIRPMLGFRYIALKERLTQIGVYNAGRTIADQTSVIDSQTHNRIYGPTLGVRLELEHRWFTIGASPSVMLAANSMETTVLSDRFLGPNDPQFRTEIDRTIFTPAFQIGVYGRAHVTENFSIHIGWDFLWMTRIVRPHDSINYNVNAVGGVPTSSAISARKALGDFQAHGLSVGGELRF